MSAVRGAKRAGTAAGRNNPCEEAATPPKHNTLHNSAAAASPKAAAPPITPEKVSLPARATLITPTKLLAEPAAAGDDGRQGWLIESMHNADGQQTSNAAKGSPVPWGLMLLRRFVGQHAEVSRAGGTSSSPQPDPQPPLKAKRKALGTLPRELLGDSFSNELYRNALARADLGDILPEEQLEKQQLLDELPVEARPHEWHPEKIPNKPAKDTPIEELPDEELKEFSGNDPEQIPHDEMLRFPVRVRKELFVKKLSKKQAQKDLCEQLPDGKIPKELRKDEPHEGLSSKEWSQVFPGEVPSKDFPEEQRLQDIECLCGAMVGSSRPGAVPAACDQAGACLMFGALAPQRPHKQRRLQRHCSIVSGHQAHLMLACKQQSATLGYSAQLAVKC
jgi:hypothetical protein